MVTLANGGAWLVNGAEIIADGPKAQAELAAKTGRTVSKEEASRYIIHTYLLISDVISLQGTAELKQ